MAEPKVVAATRENCPSIHMGDAWGHYGWCQWCWGGCARQHIHIVSNGVPIGACSEACAIQLVQELQEMRAAAR